jgi:hypothetical protein
MWANTEPLISLIIAYGGENKKEPSTSKHAAACVYTVSLSSELLNIVLSRSMATHWNNS